MLDLNTFSSIFFRVFSNPYFYSLFKTLYITQGLCAVPYLVLYLKEASLNPFPFTLSQHSPDWLPLLDQRFELQVDWTSLPWLTDRVWGDHLRDSSSLWWCHSSTGVSTVTSYQEDSVFKSIMWLGPLCMKFPWNQMAHTN